MNYKETLDWMFQQLPMYQKQGKTAFKKDLTNSLALSKHLGFPHKKFKSIHVAGTNGKGSTSHMLASVLQECGYRVGLYTSPHLKDFRERIKINGKDVSEEFVVNFIEENSEFLQDLRPSFFEMTVAMAFQYFAEENIDVAIIEVGLGGRLDSTNIITPELSVITNIGLDHTQFLGNTLEEIASEKAGIIKKGIPVVIGESAKNTRLVFEEKAQETGSCISFANEMNIWAAYPSDLKGNYQEHNKKTVIASLEILRSLGWSIDESNIKAGIAKTKSNTNLKGRWETLSLNPKVICDTAHNAEGLRCVIRQLLEEDFKKLHIVLGVVNDKDLSLILPLFPKEAKYYFCKPSIPRGMDALLLQNSAEKYNLFGETYNSVERAYLAANEAATLDDLIFIGGSTFTVAEII
ncbi:bifunctional folylpolyglutamate synthase/dihydrofolate synthase [Mesonia maritima]|uniref:Dihydrofolate synthase/folylpolyglutamate synthase n=1 Tax=Mesonia maritima TaxID=1793873 RepID=A0ABU1KBU5_9FLAO|nr:folylpolyglutamate synthase/dihydrofolate synthase family protein [Mesonia maritima]MDR6301937.1 dihydrofolate synthase/folylpolyglutamate synthase [Mesonia maritima]